jgi:hypothetical protein
MNHYDIKDMKNRRSSDSSSEMVENHLFSQSTTIQSRSLIRLLYIKEKRTRDSQTNRIL